MKIFFTRQCEKENKKGLRVANFALLIVVFKRHLGSEGVYQHYFGLVQGQLAIHYGIL